MRVDRCKPLEMKVRAQENFGFYLLCPLEFLAKSSNLFGEMMLRIMAQRPLAFWLTVSLLALGTFGVSADRGLPPQEGIINFGRINTTIYRGAQPDAAAVKNLAKMGIKSII